MKLRAAVAVVAVALTLPIYAQHGAARGGSSGHTGFAGHAGFAGHSGFTGARGISRSAPFSGQRSYARPAFGRPSVPGLAGTRVPFRGMRSEARRPLYRPAYGDRSGRWNRDRDHDHDRRRRAWLSRSYGYGYPVWTGYPYPYVIDPGFNDWGDNDDSGNASDAAPAQGYADASPYAGYDAGPEPMQEPSYAQAPAANARMPRPAYAGSTPAPEPEQSITVIFKNSSRAPESIQNYLMNSKTLTDLDQQHYEQIPLDQIDIAATEKTNRAHGLEFQVPAASHE